MRRTVHGFPLDIVVALVVRNPKLEVIGRPVYLLDVVVGGDEVAQLLEIGWEARLFWETQGEATEHDGSNEPSEGRN